MSPSSQLSRTTQATPSHLLRRRARPRPWCARTLDGQPGAGRSPEEAWDLRQRALRDPLVVPAKVLSAVEELREASVVDVVARRPAVRDLVEELAPLADHCSD